MCSQEFDFISVLIYAPPGYGKTIFQKSFRYGDEISVLDSDDFIEEPMDSPIDAEILMTNLHQLVRNCDAGFKFCFVPPEDAVKRGFELRGLDYCHQDYVDILVSCQSADILITDGAQISHYSRFIRDCFYAVQESKALPPLPAPQREKVKEKELAETDSTFDPICLVPKYTGKVFDDTSVYEYLRSPRTAIEVIIPDLSETCLPLESPSTVSEQRVAVDCPSVKVVTPVVVRRARSIQVEKPLSTKNISAIVDRHLTPSVAIANIGALIATSPSVLGHQPTLPVLDRLMTLRCVYRSGSNVVKDYGRMFRIETSRQSFYCSARLASVIVQFMLPDQK